MSASAYSPGDDSISPSASTYMISSQFNTSYHHTSSEDEIASLPSETSTESDLLSDYEDSDAEEQWRESLQQLELLLTMVLVPFIGKYAGRKCAYWGMYFWGYIPSTLANIAIINRLDEIHGMEIPRRSCHNE
jgi:hypothetical protein